MSTPKPIGEILAERRKQIIDHRTRRPLTGGAMSERIGYGNRQSCAKIEAVPAKWIPTLSKLFRICRAYDLRIEIPKSMRAEQRTKMEKDLAFAKLAKMWIYEVEKSRKSQ